MHLFRETRLIDGALSSVNLNYSVSDAEKSKSSEFEYLSMVCTKKTGEMNIILNLDLTIN